MVYLAPPPISFADPEDTPDKKKNINILVLPDGNMRFAEGKQPVAYGRGASKVMDLAKGVLHFEEIEGIRSLIFCILSNDNVQGRGPEFIRSLRAAFEKFALVGLNGVQLQICGDVEALPEGGDYDRLRGAIFHLLEKNKRDLQDLPDLQDPKTLEMWLNYGPKKIYERGGGISGILRTGMERAGEIRIGGLANPPSSTALFGVADLFPALTLERFRGIITMMKNAPRPVFAGNFSDLEMHNLVEAAATFTPRAPIAVSLPFEHTGPLQTGPFIFRPFAGERDELSVAHDTDVMLTGQQEDRPFFLPPNAPEVGYGHIKPCTGLPLENPRAVLEAINEFAGRSTESLRGAERVIVMGKPKIELPEMGKLEEMDEDEALEYKNYMRFLRELLLWVEKLPHFAWKDEAEFSAMIGYWTTCYVLSSDLRGAKILATYMTAVTLMDYRVFDQDYPSKILQAAKMQMKEALDPSDEERGFKNEMPPHPVRDICMTISGILRDLRCSFMADADIMSDWVREMKSLLDAELKEKNWDAIRNLPMNWPDVERYMNTHYLVLHKSRWLKNKLRSAFPKNGKSDKNMARLILYLTQIENSIGASLTYRTYLCVNSANLPKDKPLYAQFEELAILINFYYRLLNDLSSLEEDEINTAHVLEDLAMSDVDHGQFPRMEALICMRDFAKELEVEIKECVGKMRVNAANHHKRTGEKNWPELMGMIDRTAFAKEIYKAGHYKDARGGKSFWPLVWKYVRNRARDAMLEEELPPEV